MIATLCDSQLEAIIFGVTEIMVFKRASGELGDAILAKGRADFATFFAWLESQLGGRDWFNGDAYGMGDMAVLREALAQARASVTATAPPPQTC